MPDAFEFPGTLRAVIELVGRKRFAGLSGSIVDELVTFTPGHLIAVVCRIRAARLLPGFATAGEPLT